MTAKFRGGELIYFTQGQSLKAFNKREKEKEYNTWTASSYGTSAFGNSDVNVALGRVTGPMEPGFFHEEEMSYKMQVTIPTPQGTIEVYEGDQPTKFPMQQYTILEQILQGTLKWRDIKNREIVIISFAERRRTNTDESDKRWENVYLVGSKAITVATRHFHYSMSTATLKNEDQPLQPIFANLRGIRKNINAKSEYKAKEFKFIITAPNSSWDQNSGNVGAAAIRTHYLTKRAMQSAWFREDYDEYVKNLPEEETKGEEL